MIRALACCASTAFGMIILSSPPTANSAQSARFARQPTDVRPISGAQDPDPVDPFVIEAEVGVLLDHVRHRLRTSGLTAREEQMLALAAVGRSTRQIAAELFISEKTARNHLQHIYTKAGVSNRAGASLYAVQHGIIRAAPRPW